MRRFVGLALAATLAVAGAGPAAAWTRPGHMVTAAIAYDEIQRARPDLLAAIAALLDAHPDRGPFQVAIDRTSGAERARRMFLECARWPDDVRQSAYDHPTWHMALKPIVADDAPAAVKARIAAGSAIVGDALPGLALNLHTLADGHASAGERAMAMCWALHVIGDMHQPFHTAQLFSAAYPDGDLGGTRQFVQDPLTHEPIALHWLWDDSINRSGVAADVDRRAREIEAAHPRASLPELKVAASPDRIVAWAHEESYPIAVTFAYGARIPTGATAAAAPPVPDAYWQEVRQRSEIRMALAGYRMADLVIAAMDQAAKP